MDSSGIITRLRYYIFKHWLITLKSYICILEKSYQKKITEVFNNILKKEGKQNDEE